MKYLVGSVDSGIVCDSEEVASVLAKAHNLKTNRLRDLNTIEVYKEESLIIVEGRHIPFEHYPEFSLGKDKIYRFSNVWTGITAQVDFHMGFIRLPIDLNTYHYHKEEIYGFMASIVESRKDAIRSGNYKATGWNGIWGERVIRDLLNNKFSHLYSAGQVYG
jgi:hypothetical protein